MATRRQKAVGVMYHCSVWQLLPWCFDFFVKFPPPKNVKKRFVENHFGYFTSSPQYSSQSHLHSGVSARCHTMITDCTGLAHVTHFAQTSHHYYYRLFLTYACYGHTMMMQSSSCQTRHTHIINHFVGVAVRNDPPQDELNLHT